MNALQFAFKGLMEPAFSLPFASGTDIAGFMDSVAFTDFSELFQRFGIGIPKIFHHLIVHVDINGHSS
ncbi:hypothetical protein GCM10011386_41350 [Parapedobacter defluvii]|uniref:Uncharacterized protein n=1 Tax=Parapedobacter defluvii TaxID=2045106 RepID=A0ABQ1MQ82_9SPHI|nr:hypothetical protein GCM10011386_41350 [Parapedobacter defluvii]